MSTVTLLLRLVPMGVALAGFAPWVLVGDMENGCLKVKG